MHYRYAVKGGHVPCCWLGEAGWLAIPVSFYKLLFFMYMEWCWEPNCQEPKLCLTYLLNTNQPVSSHYGHKAVLVILSRCCSTIPGTFHWGLSSSLQSQPLVSPETPLKLYCVCVLRGSHLPVNCALLLMIKIKLMC